jgi:hypothetical protein
MKISMPPVETEALKEIIDSAENIIEYGSGGSTLYAGKSKAKTIITTENDKNFLDKVISKYPKDGPKLFPVYSYTGLTGMWGYPLNDAEKHLWKNYPMSPWKIAKEYDISPDTIIIDGRFRVASFLYSIGHAKSETAIFWDDYLNRKYYHVVEDICKPVAVFGRSALFVKNNESFDQEMFDKYCSDMR